MSNSYKTIPTRLIAVDCERALGARDVRLFNQTHQAGRWIGQHAQPGASTPWFRVVVLADSNPPGDVTVAVWPQVWEANQGVYSSRTEYLTQVGRAATLALRDLMIRTQQGAGR